MDTDIASITATSQNDTNVDDYATITTGAVMTAPWLDDFEFGTFGGSSGVNWTSDNPLDSGVSTATANSGTYSMYVYDGPVNVDSWIVDTSSLSAVEVLAWVRAGSSAFGTGDPDFGENLVLLYSTSLVGLQ